MLIANRQIRIVNLLMLVLHAGVAVKFGLFPALEYAEITGLASNPLHIKSLILNYYFSRNAPHERFQHCKRLSW